MNILFITRKYPPQIGGMEKYSYNLIKNFPGQKQVIFLNKSQRHLIWWLPYAFFKTLFIAKNFDLIYLCDGLLAPLGYLIKKITKRKVVVTCHGLDVIYPPRWYQKNIIPALKNLDKIICVSKAAIEECLKRGISREKLMFIPNGVDIKLKNQNAKIRMTNKNLRLKNFEINLDNKNILLTVGRLVKRKGVAWFCENVMTKLPKDIIYLVVGSGPEKRNIKNLIKKFHLEKSVFSLGKLSAEDLERVYSVADIFVMPNIKIKWDIEGFGQVALEAGNYGLPVIASNLEGISDAIKHEQNGILAPPQNADEFIRQINILLKDLEKKQSLVLRALKYNQENFNWQKIGQRYYCVLQNLH